MSLHLSEMIQMKTRICVLIEVQAEVGSDSDDLQVVFRVVRTLDDIYIAGSNGRVKEPSTESEAI